MAEWHIIVPKASLNLVRDPVFRFGVPSIGEFVPVDVPQEDANALIHFYNLTDGDNWTNNTGWLVDTTVGNWFGVTVTDGRVTGLDLSSDTAVYGDIGDWIMPEMMDSLSLERTSVHGDISEWVLGKWMRIFNLSFTGIFGYADISACVGIEIINVSDCGLDQPDVDKWIQSVYNNRMNFEHPTPRLNAGGTNAAPSGTYQAACPPDVGQEQAYELENDSCGDGFIVWGVDFTGHP